MRSWSTCNPLIKDGDDLADLCREGSGVGCLRVLAVRGCADDGVMVEELLWHLALLVILGQLLGCGIALHKDGSLFKSWWQ